MARRSPRTALLVAGPPAPGPERPTVPSGSASISIRFVTPSVQPNGLSAGTAVGTTAASMVSPRRVAVASSLIVRPSAAAPSSSWSRHAGDAGLAVAARARRPPADVAGIEPLPERQPREDHELVDRIVALDVAARIGLGVAQLLRVLEDLVVRPAVLGHRGQDVVRRAVDDAAHPADLVRGEVRGDACRAPGSHRRRRPRTGARAPVWRAAASSSGPWCAMTCLLAVTTALPARSAATISVRAGSSPPMTSTITSISGSATRWAGASVRRSARMPAARARSRSRTATPTSVSAAPSALTRRSARSRNPSATARPDRPRPEHRDAHGLAAHRRALGGGGHGPRMVADGV